MAATAGAAGAAAAAAAGKRRAVVWLRNDLRVLDNPLLHEAAQLSAGRKVDEVLPVYVFDPRTYALTPYGDLKTGAFRATFLLESVLDLKARLKAEVGSDLLVLTGKPEELIPGLLRGCAAPLVITSQEVTKEELTVDTALERALKPAGGRVQRLWDHTLYHLDDLQGPQGPFNRGIQTMGDVFTPFKEKCERGAFVRAELPAPKKGSLPLPPPSSSVPGPGGAPEASLEQLLKADTSLASLPWPNGRVPQEPQPHPNAVLKFKGGETAALARLKYYLWDSGLLSTYFDTRNGMLGGDYSTKFAPWLAAGCLSPRTVHAQIKQYEAQKGGNKSTYWVIFELIWRDFYRFFTMKHGNRIFYEYGPTGKRLQWTADPQRYARWAEGRTGLPLVDANMRELAATGFMSNRGRQNVASHLILDLGVDWRKGAFWFESLLLDYDVTSNWGNWVSAAGLTGGRVNAFNITKQSKDYDLQGNYIRTWVPELKNVPSDRIHEPWLMSQAEMSKYGVQIGTAYPAPLPTKQYARLQYSGEGGGGGGGRGGGGGYGGGGARGGVGNDRSRQSGGRPQSGRPAFGKGARQSEFERFG